MYVVFSVKLRKLQQHNRVKLEEPKEVLLKSAKVETACRLATVL